MARTVKNALARAVVFAALLASTGCPSAAPKEPPGASAEAREKAEAAAKEAVAALEAAPLSSLRARAAGERLLEAGRAGRAHALLLAAKALVLDPPPQVEAAGAAISGGSGGGSLSGPEAPPGAVDPAGPGGLSALEAAISEAEKAGRPEARAAQVRNPARDRQNRARDDALRFYREKQYAKALERLEKLTTQEEPRLARFLASCHVNLAIAATEEGKDAAAVDHLWCAADADPARRGAALYRDVARLERRIAVTRQGAQDMAGCDAALRRAFRAAPDDPETLYLLSRRKDLPYAEREWYERRLARLHPDEARAEFLAAAEAVRGTADVVAAGEVVDRFAAKNPQQGALAADLRSLVADKARGEAAKDAASARTRYEEAAQAARASRIAFESGMREDGLDPDPPAGPRDGPAGPVEAPKSGD